MADCAVCTDDALQHSDNVKTANIYTLIVICSFGSIQYFMLLAQACSNNLPMSCQF